ncbi:MAG: hypothetical protein Q9219_001667 [cf. Caloplaca sp. 3 TL-2023]
MLPFLFVSSLVVTTTLARSYSIQDRAAVVSCPRQLQASQTPGVNNIVFDTDNHFVYDPDNCTTTDQKIIPRGFPIVDCTPAIHAICGTTSTVSAVAGSWTWAWHTDQGATCQAGLYQAIDADSDGKVGFLDPQCCRANFEAILNAMRQAGLDAWDDFNRLSVNIAPGGFPFTQNQFEGGGLVNADGLRHPILTRRPTARRIRLIHRERSSTFDFNHETRMKAREEADLVTTERDEV